MCVQTITSYTARYTCMIRSTVFAHAVNDRIQFSLANNLHYAKFCLTGLLYGLLITGRRYCAKNGVLRSKKLSRERETRVI